MFHVGKSLFQKPTFISLVAPKPKRKETGRVEETFIAATLVVIAAALVIAAVFTHVLPAIASIPAQSVAFVFLARRAGVQVTVRIFALCGYPISEEIPRVCFLDRR